MTLLLINSFTSTLLSVRDKPSHKVKRPRIIFHFLNTRLLSRCDSPHSDEAIFNRQLTDKVKYFISLKRQHLLLRCIIIFPDFSEVVQSTKRSMMIHSLKCGITCDVVQWHRFSSLTKQLCEWQQIAFLQTSFSTFRIALKRSP